MIVRKEVVRVDDTIRRPWQPWSPAIQSLLGDLEAKGFAGAPRWRGKDPEGREVLTYVDGDVPDYPLDASYWSDVALVGVARLLRAFHDATVDLVGGDLPWRFGYPGTCTVEVICHNDVSPYNTVYEEGMPKAFIDFDTAGPGPRVWDVSYAAYRFVPLLPREDFDRPGVPKELDIQGRLNRFCRAYGEFAGDFLEELILRLEVLATHIRIEAGRGVPWHVENLSNGHDEMYERQARWLVTQKELVSRAIEQI